MFKLVCRILTPVLTIATVAQAAAAAPVTNRVRGVVITTPGLETSSAKAFATSHDKLLLSDYLEQSRPGSEQELILRQKLDRAQRAWLAGNIEEAQSEFRGLSEMALKADWKEAQREALQTALLRLAQTSDSSSDRSNWVESAARLYSDLAPNTNVFPPPLMNEYQATVKRLQATAIEIDLRDVFPDFRYVLIDGRKFEISVESRAKILTGSHRFTAFSDSHESLTEFMTAGQLRVMRLSPPALTEGVCTNAVLKSHSALPSHIEVEIASGEGCPAKLDVFARHDSSHELRLPELPSDSNASTKSSKTWIWIVGGALLAGAAYAVASHTSSSSPEPTHRSGF